MIRSFCDCDRDTYGFCPIHDPKAIACRICQQIVIQGSGMAAFEAGDDGAVGYDPHVCNRCYVAYVRDLALAARELLS